MTSFVREVDAITYAITALRDAHDANDLARWHEARTTVDRLVATADLGQDKASARAGDAAGDASAQLTASRRALADSKAAAHELIDRPPAGYKPVSRETELLAAITRRPGGTTRAGMEVKERAICAQLAMLSPVESRVLATRLDTRVPEDQLAAAFASPANLGNDRRLRLVAFLGGARRREALASAKAPQRAPSPSPEAPQALPDDVRGDLETATGRSLAHVRIHAGTEGNAKAAAHGVRALAIGSDIFMAEGQLAPATEAGRELIAHEVAHVLQAAMPPGSHAPADRDPIEAAEVEADVFAARFRSRGGSMRWQPSVSVRSGAAMHAPAVGARVTPAEAHGDASPAKVDVAWAYLRANEAHFVAAIQERLTGFLPAAHPRLAWIPGGSSSAFPQALAGALGSDQLFIRLPELAHPIDPWYVIDQNRALVDGAPGVVVAGKEPTGPLAWNPFAGEALAIQLVARLRESFERMVPRYVTQLEANTTVAVADLVASHPLDRVVARLLCDARVVRPVPPGRGHNRGKDASQFPDGVRMLDDFRWLGDQNPALWNWVEVRAPRNATREDLAATLWMDVDASYRAFIITGAAPYFRLDPSWARTFEQARKHAPDGPDKRDDDGLVLAESSFATDAAIAQAANERKFDKHGIPLPADTVRLAAVLETSSRQLDRAKELLKPWKLWEPLLPALQWVASYREHLLAVPAARLIGLAPVIEGQQGILFEAVGAIQDVCDAAGSAVTADGDNGPIAGVLRAYAIAIGESHLIDSARAQIATARRAKSGMALALLERSLHESHEAVRDLASNESEPSFETKTADANNATFQRQLVDMRAKQSAGEAIDEADVELLSAHVKEQAFDARAKALSRQLWNLVNEAGDAKSGGYATLARLFGDHGEELGVVVGTDGAEQPAGSKIGDLDRRLAAMARDLDESVIKACHDEKATRNNDMAAQLTDVGGAQEKKSRAWVVNESVRHAEQHLATFVTDHKLDVVIQKALSQIEDQRLRTTAFQIVIQMGLLIGVSLIGGVVGNVVAGAVRGSLLADAAVASAGMLRSVQTAQTVGTIAGIATDAAVNAAGQVLIGGGSGSDAFIDNLISSAAIRVALAPLHKLASTWGAAEQELKNLDLWEKTAKRGFVLRKGIVLTAEMITGAAINYAVQRARHSGQAPDEKTAVDWAVEGASMAIGAFASHQLAGLDSRLVQMAEHGAHLRGRAKRLRALAARVEQTGDKSAALDLLIAHHELLLDEAEQISHLEALSKGKITAQTRRTLEAGNKAELTGVHDKAFAMMRLRLAGLAPDDASGKIWVGAADHVEPALDQAVRAGLHVEVIERDIGARTWRIRYEGDEITIQETEPHDHTPSAEPVGAGLGAEIKEPRTDPEKTREDDQHAPAKVPTAPAVDLGLGAEIAGEVPGTSYETGGAFHIKVGDHEISISVRRTGDRTKIVREPTGIVLEIPKGLGRAELKKEIVDRIAELHRHHGGDGSPYGTTTSALTEQQRAVIERSTPEPSSTTNDGRPRLDEFERHAFQTPEQQDASRWQDHGIEEAAEAARKHGDNASADEKQALALESDPELRLWFGRWKSLPDRITVQPDGSYQARLPAGIPEHIAARLREAIPKTNILLTTRALAIREQVVRELPGVSLDPTAPDWPATRKRLVELFGEERVAKYEHSRTQLQHEPGRADIDSRINEVVAQDSLDQLGAMFPGVEIYVTGSASQPRKKGESTTDVDIVAVVPERTPQRVREEMERRMNALQLKRPPPKRLERAAAPLPIDAKVMTPSEFAGMAMIETPAKRTPLNYARIDSPVLGPMPGTGESGGDLHAHMLGVTPASYFIDRVGGGDAIATLDKTLAAIHDPKLRGEKPEVVPVTGGVLRQLETAIADVRSARDAGMPGEVVQVRAQRALDDVLAASKDTPYDHTYDLRDLLIQAYIDPNGRFENFATDAITTLHDQGVTYSEQSVSLGKLQKRFTPEAMANAHARAGNRDSELKFLVMSPNDQTLASEKPSAVAKALRDQLMRPDVKGIDVAAPEAQPFTAAGMTWLGEQIQIAREVALVKGEAIVVRPHVGEGYPDASGEHVKIARHNLELVITKLETAKYHPGDGVIVRFGHATHATARQLARIAQLGVIVEANVGSNLATGSIARAEDHPLLANMYFGVSTVLATDGQGVMDTTLPVEYQRAAALIEQFRGGNLTLDVGDKRVRFADLGERPDVQARFSIQWLTEQLAAYRRAATAPVKGTRHDE